MLRQSRKIIWLLSNLRLSLMSCQEESDLKHVGFVIMNRISGTFCMSKILCIIQRQGAGYPIFLSTKFKAWVFDILKFVSRGYPVSGIPVFDEPGIRNHRKSKRSWTFAWQSLEAGCPALWEKIQSEKYKKNLNYTLLQNVILNRKIKGIHANSINLV